MGAVERIRAALTERKVEIAVVELAESTRTAAMAAATLGSAVGAIVKSLVLLADERVILVLASGDRQVDLAKVGALVGARTVALARGAAVKELTGFAIGGVPPLVSDATGRQVTTLMDENLFRFKTVYASAGSPYAIFPVSPAELRRITGATVAAVAAGEHRHP